MARDETSRRRRDNGDVVDGLLQGAAGLCDDGPRIRALCADARRAFLRQPMLLRLRAPVKVVGDLHGQFADLLRVFDAVGRPPEIDFLFLGDFVDRGPQSVEVSVPLLTNLFLMFFGENFPRQKLKIIARAVRRFKR